MSTSPKIENLRKEFAAILKLYNDIVTKKLETESKINGIKDVYNGLVKTNPAKTFLFCLDSLFFQYKILNLELEHYNKKVALLQNRMYGDYYKLHLMILGQIKDAGIVLEGGEAAREFPIYKDIDPFYKYKLEDITAIHDRILSIFGELYDVYHAKTANIKKYRDSIAVGESIMIFINAMEHEKDAVMGHIQMFSQYLDFYHQSQARYLDCVYRGLVDFYVNLEDSVLVCADGCEALAEPHTESFENYHIQDIYRVNENLDSESEKEVINLQMLGSQEDVSSTETILASYPPAVGIPPNTSDASSSNNASVSFKMHIETEKSDNLASYLPLVGIPPNTPDFKSIDDIPQNITMEVGIDMDIVNEEHHENVSII